MSNQDRLARLRELIDEENPIDGIHDHDVAELFAAACAPPGEADAECPRYLACTSEGSGESDYRCNPDFCAGDAEAIEGYLAGSDGEGWATNWVVDLETGKAVSWTRTVTLDIAEREGARCA